MKNLNIIVILFVYILDINQAYSRGDLTRQHPIEVEVLMKGLSGNAHYYEPSEFTFKTGNLYILKIKNVSDSKHYFSSTSFANSIFTRKIQLIKNDKKIAEIKGIIKEIEVFPNNSLEWWFVPIKTGQFNDLNCHIKDSKTGKTHSEMGMVGRIVIE